MQSFFTIDEVIHSTERHKFFMWRCISTELKDNITSIQNFNINVVNIGKEVALFVDSLVNHKYLQLEVQEFIIQLLNRNKTNLNGSVNNVVAIYNIGILLEPIFQLNPVQLLKDYSKSVIIILIWENDSNSPNLLHWPTQEKKYSLDFSDVTISQLHHAV